MAADINNNQQGNKNNDDFGLPKAEFKPIESTTNNRWLKLTVIIIGAVIMIGGVLVVWLFQRPSQNKKPDFMADTLESHQEEEEEMEDEIIQPDNDQAVERPTTELPKPKPVDVKEQISKEAKEKDLRISSKKISEKLPDNQAKDKKSVEDSDEEALDELDKISDSFIAKPEHKPSSFIEQLRAGEFEHKKTGKVAQVEDAEPIEILNKPQGRYYIVIESYVDFDLAMDSAKKLAKTGEHVKLFRTYQNDLSFVRLAIAHELSIAELKEKLAAYKEHYPDAWIVKY
jgi:hypothetical protein